MMKRATHIYVLAVVGLLAVATVVAVTRFGASPAAHHVKGSAGAPRAGCKSRTGDPGVVREARIGQEAPIDADRARRRRDDSSGSSVHATAALAVVRVAHAGEMTGASRDAGIKLLEGVGRSAPDPTPPGDNAAAA